MSARTSAAISCRARRDGDDWVINGNKYWCTFADGADYIMLVARTSDPPDPKRKHVGLSSFLIEKPRGTLPPGVKGAPIPKIGYFGWKTWELAFDDCRLPGSALIGEEGRAFYYISAGLERARAHTAARSIGLARGALEDATAYAQERRQFGQAIGDFQNTRFRLARMATEIEAARQLMYFVCDEIDQKRRCDKEAAMVKLFASEMAERVTSEALQVFGGAGYTTLHAVERYWRDAGSPRSSRARRRSSSASSPTTCWANQRRRDMELDAPMAHIVRGILMVGATGIVQVVAQLALSRMMDVLPSPPESRYPTFYMLTHSVSAVMILLIGHVLQVTLWAALYFYDWGAFKSFGTAMYFSLASFTTLGAAELSLPPQHRMIGAFESAAGMMMFGWSTALLVAVVVRTDRRARP